MQDDQAIKCLLCDGQAILRHSTYPGYKEPTVFQIYHCKNCQTAFSIPRLDDTKELYETIYRNKSEIPGYCRYWKYAEDVKAKERPLDYLADTEDIYWGIRQALVETIANKDSVKILEIGSGLGYLTYALRKSGYNCFGLDISETAVNHARFEYGDYYRCENIFDLAEKEVESFDLIIMTEVIEHVDEPMSFFRASWRLIKPHGKVIITTPNKSFFPSDMIWTGECPPIHCWWFSEESMSYIANQLNANVAFIDFSSYYKVHYTWYDINELKKHPYSVSVLDKSGQVIKYLEQKHSFQIMDSFRKNFSRITFLKNIVRKIRIILNPSIIVSGQRGQAMCALFEKL